MVNLELIPWPTLRLSHRRKKATRAAIRLRNAGKKRIPHGGRGRKYGFKGGHKQQKRRK